MALAELSPIVVVRHTTNVAKRYRFWLQPEKSFKTDETASSDRDTAKVSRGLRSRLATVHGLFQGKS